MKEFWSKQAREHGFGVEAVNFDPLEEELEIHFLEPLFRDGETVCDIGCGNGRTTLYLAQKMQGSRFYGVDFIDEMISSAEKQRAAMNIGNASFFTADAASEGLPGMFDVKFDKIMSKRLLINLKGADNKMKAVRNIHSMLKTGGIYVMIECFREPLDGINIIRKELGLEVIAVKPFNEYLTGGFMNEMSELFEIQEKRDFESLYYFISRIYNAYLSSGKPDYNSPINKLAVTLTKMGVKFKEGYSPEVMYLLRKR